MMGHATSASAVIRGRVYTHADIFRYTNYNNQHNDTAARNNRDAPAHQMILLFCVYHGAQYMNTDTGTVVSIYRHRRYNANRLKWL